jgi:thiamine transport system substrate-binding protein
MLRTRLSLPVLALSVTMLLTACASDSGSSAADSNTVRLLAYDSFTPPKEVWEDFTQDTGITVEVLLKGDTGSMLNTAILSKDEPIADVIWGIDSTFLSRAITSDILRPHNLTAPVDPALQPVEGADVVIPVDQSQVCVNVDTRAIPNAETLGFDSLTDPQLKDSFVVQNPASSAPGMAFLLATIAKYGETGWQEYWRKLVDNGVKVVNGWDEAWTTEFSGAGTGKRSMVVSYANSPAAFVLFGTDPSATTTPIQVVKPTCIAVAEYAGLLGDKNNEAANKLLEFLISERFQNELATNLFVYPARTGVELPEIYTRLGVEPAEKPFTIDAKRVQAMRDVWVDEWTEIVLG